MNLSELIDTHRGNRSYPELERACGGSPSSKRLQQLVRGGIKNFPDPSTVRALAQGLRVSQAAVVLAAAESLGLDVRTSMPRVVELLSADADALTEEQAAAVAHLVQTIVKPPKLEIVYVEETDLIYEPLAAVASDPSGESTAEASEADEVAKKAAEKQRAEIAKLKKPDQD